MTTKTIASVGLALILTAIFSVQTEARGFRCGATQRAYFGVGSNLALDWAKDFPHVSAQPGAVVVQTRKGRALGGGQGGHVSRIVQLTGSCRAIVADDRGQYERDICSHLVAYVMPTRNEGRITAHRLPHRRVQVASYIIADRHGLH